jgi:hypothetical protein
MLSMAVCLLAAGAAVRAQQRPAPPPPVPTSPPAAAKPPPTDPGDEGFIEFLGSDDTGDAAWWEFLKRAPRGVNPAPPPQDAKQ